MSLVKNTTYRSILLAIAMLLVGCSVGGYEADDDIWQNPVLFTVEKQVSADIQTKTTDNENSTTWSEADNIVILPAPGCEVAGGVIGGQRTALLAEYSVKDGWVATNQIYYKAKNDWQNHRFYGYYPYEGDTAPQIDPHKALLPSLQTQTGSYDPSKDFLYTPLTQKSTSTSVLNFNFTHLFAMVEFNLSCQAELAGLIVTSVKLKSLKGYTLFCGENSTIDLTDLSTTYTVGTGASECSVPGPGAESPLTLTPQPLLLFVVPQIDANSESVLELTVDNTLTPDYPTTIIHPLPAAHYLSGHRYVYNVNIKKKI